MHPPRLFPALALAAALAAPALLPAAPADDAAGYKASLSDNLAAASSFLADPFAKAFAFNVASQGFAPPAARSLLGFNLGLGGGVAVTSIDKSGVKNASLSNGTDLSEFAKSLPDALPVPLGLLDVHLGLPKLLFFESLDLGLRWKGFNYKDANADIAISGWGVELRGNVFEAGLVSPLTLTLGLSLDSLQSKLSSSSASASTSGTYGSFYTGTTAFKLDIDSAVQSYSVFASVSRKLLVVVPYAGVALNMVSGETTVTGTQVTNLTFGSGPVATLAEDIVGKSTKPAPSLDMRLAGGLQLDVPFFYLELGAEYGVVSGGAGAHAQLGLHFR